MPKRDPKKLPLPTEMIGLPQRVAIAVGTEQSRRKESGEESGYRAFTGLPPSQISRLINTPGVDPGLSTLIRIANGTGVRLAWLAVGEEPKEQQPVIGLRSLALSGALTFGDHARAIEPPADQARVAPQRTPGRRKQSSGGKKDQ